jgi:hypothetical protein
VAFCSSAQSHSDLASRMIASDRLQIEDAQSGEKTTI